MDYAWHWRIIQDGMKVAGGVCPDRRRMESEMGHYAAVYGQDGPVTMQSRTGKNKWRTHSG